MHLRRTATFFIALLGLPACATLNSPTFADDTGAIRGYDPVAYRTDSRPIKGSPAISFEYNGADWHFASEENRALFRQDPEYYTPQYGGYCAYAMSRGFVVATDPNAWKIDNDKLYLNFSPGVQEKWLKDIPGYVSRADTKWREKTEQ